MGEVLERAPEMDTEYTENTTARQTVKCASDLQMRSENYTDMYLLVCHHPVIRQDTHIRRS